MVNIKRQPVNISEKELGLALAGIAQAQAALLAAMAPADKLQSIQRLQSTLGGITGAGKLLKAPLTWKTLPAHLLLHAMATPGPTGKSLEEVAHQETERLSQRHAAP